MRILVLGGNVFLGRQVAEQSLDHVTPSPAWPARPAAPSRPGCAGSRPTRSGPGYWPGRFARGGDVLVPGDDGPAQVLDVRDLASCLLLVAGLGTPLVADAVGAAVTRVEPDDAWLLEHGVEPNMGPESLPLWLPLPDWAGVSARDDTRAVDASLARRPPAETLAARSPTSAGSGSTGPARPG